MSKSKEAQRAGATSQAAPTQGTTDGLIGKEVGPDQDMLDLFLTEENLIRLAMGHLGGRHPPGAHAPTSVSSSAALLKKQKLESMANQPPRLRKLLSAKLQRELQARSWTAHDLSEHSKLSVSDCRALLNGSGFFTKEVAAQLATCLATSELYWMSEGHD